MPRSHPPYPAEYKAEAERLARGGEWPIPARAADLGISTEALRSSLRRADADAGAGPPGELTGAEHEELRRLRRESHALRQEREILKKWDCPLWTDSGRLGPNSRGYPGLRVNPGPTSPD